MKKAILLVVLGLLFAPFARAADEPVTPEKVYFFGDGKGYDEDGTQKYYCFGTTTQSCYSVEGVFAFTRELQGLVAGLQNQITQLQNTVSQLQKGAVGAVEPLNDIPSTTPPPTLLGLQAINWVAPNNKSEVNFGNPLQGVTAENYPKCDSPYGPSILTLKFDQPSKLKLEFLAKDADFPAFTHGTDSDYEQLQTFGKTKPLITKETTEYKKLWLFCHTDLNLSEDTTYYFKIQAENQTGSQMIYTTEANGKNWEFYYSNSIRY